MSQDISTELNGARYAMGGIEHELSQVENGGYFSMAYVDEKLLKIRDACKRIAQLKNFPTGGVLICE